MRSRWLSFAVLATALILSVGCQSSGGDDGVTAPDMGSAVDLPSTGGTSPTTEEEALTLFSGAASALMSQIETSGYTPTGSARAARATSDQSGVISWTGSYGGGTVDISGTYASLSTIPDEYIALALGGSLPNSTFAITSSLDLDLSGTVSAVELSHEGNTYTVSGRMVEEIASNTNCVIRTTSSGLLQDATISGTYAMTLVYGMAMSVVNQGGVGAKFIISVAASGSGQLDDPEGDASVDGTATLTVYDDANTVLYEIDLTSEEMPGSGGFE